jgi:regulator of protease activity HflC (stomatin/prohibitin superfamily)
MVLIILGIIILIVSFSIKNVPNISAFGKVGRFIGLAFIILGIVTSCFVQIDAGQVGVKKLFGKVQPEVLTSGLNFVNPLYEVDRLDVRTLNYTMSGINDEGHKTGDDAIKVLTSDGLEVTIDLTVLYRVIPSEAPRLIKETGIDYEDKIVPVFGIMQFITKPFLYIPQKEMNFKPVFLKVLRPILKAGVCYLKIYW